MMILSIVVALMLAGEPAAAPDCPTLQQVQVFHREARWWLEATGTETVADVAAYVRAHPPASVRLSTDYYGEGNTAVSTVDEAFKGHGIRAEYVWITSGPWGGSAPTPPDGYMDVSIQVDCNG